MKNYICRTCFTIYNFEIDAELRSITNIVIYVNSIVKKLVKNELLWYRICLLDLEKKGKGLCFPHRVLQRVCFFK